MNLLDKFMTILGINSVLDIVRVTVDLSVVFYAVYWVYKLVRSTRAYQLIKGIIFLIILTLVSGWLRLTTIHYILITLMTYGAFAILIIFQPELRKLLEQIGRSKFKDWFNVSLDENNEEKEKVIKTINEVVNAVDSLSRNSTGALITFEKGVKIGDIIENGILLNSQVSAELLVNIFTPNTPLHDGAVVIGGNKILSAGCVLPLTQNTSINKELGTRHRAAIGISEVSDAIVVVVSEETGIISLAEDGKLIRNFDVDSLRVELVKQLVTTNNVHRKISTLFTNRKRA